MSSSNSDLCNCGPCNSGAPWQYMVHVPAVSNGFCTECAGYEGTYILDLISTDIDICYWKVDGSFPCGPVNMILNIFREVDGSITMRFYSGGSVVGWSATIKDCLAENVLGPISIPTCDNNVYVTVIPIIEEGHEPVDCFPKLVGCQHGSVLGPGDPVPATCPPPATRLTPGLDNDCELSPCKTGNCGSGAKPIRSGTPNNSPVAVNEGTGGAVCQLCTPPGADLDPVPALNYLSTYSQEKRTAYGFSERYQRTITELSATDVILQTGAGIKYPFRKLDSGTGFYKPPFGSTSKLQKVGSAWQETTEEFWVNDYDSTGRVITMSAPGGAIWTLSYSGSSQRITSIESPVGRRVSYGYDGNNHLSKITDAGGRETLISIDTNGDLVSFTTPELCVTNLGYDASHRLTRYQDPMGYVYSYAYDTESRVQSVQAPNGATTTYQYSTGRRVGVINPLGAIETLTFNVSGNPIAIQNPLGFITTLGWDRNRLASVKNPLGETHAYTYQSIANAGLRLQTHSTPMGQVYSYNFDTDGHFESVVNPLGHINTTAWNASDQRTNCIDALAAVHTFGYATTGQVKSVTNPLGAVITFHFNVTSDVEAIENPLGYRTSYVHDVAGRTIATIDPLGYRTSRTLDDMNRLVATESPLGFRNTFTYNLLSQQTSAMNPLGFITTSVFDANRRKIATVNALGYRTTSDFDLVGRNVATTDALGAKTTIVYDVASRPVASVNPLGFITTSIFDSASRRIASEAPLGFRSTTLFDANSRAIATEDPLGRRNSSYYDAASRAIATENPLGFRTTNVYDAANRMIATQNALGNRATNVFDVAGQQVASINPLGALSTSVFDIGGRVTASISPLGFRSTNVYDANSRAIAAVDPLGRRTSMHHDPDGRNVATENPLGYRSTNHFDAASQVIAREDALGYRSTNVHDALGRQLARVNALGYRATSIYDAVNRVVAAENARGYRDTTEFDIGGRTTASINALGSRSTYGYDPMSRPVVTENPRGYRTTSVFDAASQLTATENALGFRTTNQYDLASRRVAVMDARGFRSTNVFDAIGQVTASIDPLGRIATQTHDAAQRPIASQDGNGNVTTNIYDANDRRVAILDALGYLTTNVYDQASQQVAMLDPRGNSWSTTYDAASRPVATIDPLNRRVTTGYDAASRRTLRTDARGNVTTYTNDALGQNLGWLYPNGQRATFSYDPTSNRTDMADWTGEYAYQYTALNQLAAESNPLGKRLTYGYDSVQSLSLLMNADGGSNTYQYDALSRVTVTQDPAGGRTTTAYDATNNRTLKVLPNGTRSSNVFDGASQLVDLTHLKSDDSVIGRYQYTYDNASNVTLTTETSGDTVNWSYDALYRLTGDVRTGANSYEKQFTYDPVANRLVENASGALTTSTYDAANQLSSSVSVSGTTQYTFDNSGNQQIVQAPGGALTTSAWDYENQNTRVLLVTGSSVDMQFNAANRRIAKQSTLTDKVFLWSSATDNIIQDLSPAGVSEVANSFLPGTYGELIKQVDSESSFFLFDRRGSTMAIASAAQVIADTFKFDGYGNVVAQTGSSLTPYQFQGAWGYFLDVELGGLYIRRRVYSQVVGRWLSVDPLGFVDGANLFSPYFIPVNGDPLGTTCLGPFNPEPCEDIDVGRFVMISWIEDLAGSEFILNATANPEPPELLSDRAGRGRRGRGPQVVRTIGQILHSKEYRNIHLIAPTIRCCGGKVDRVTSFGNEQHAGYTPQPGTREAGRPIYLQGKQGPHDLSHEKTDDDTCVVITSRQRFRVNWFENRLQAIHSWSLLPYAWSEIEVRFCCDGEAGFGFTGSVIPSYHAYVNEALISKYSMGRGDIIVNIDNFRGAAENDDAPERAWPED